MTQTVPPQPTGRAPDELVADYAAAWNAHDGAAVAALVTGSYVDPTLPEPLCGDAVAAMVDGLCAAFPDLRFEHVGTTVQGDRAVFEWRMQGTNSGAALPGAPAPTGGTIDLPGIDVVTTEAGRIVDVVGYFDQKAFLEQLGLQVLPVPKDEWPISFGVSVRMDLGNTTLPGAMTFTWIDIDESEQGELLSRTTDILTALASEPSFIGFQSTTVGRRGTTIALWSSPEAAEAALARNAPHNAAMQRVEQDGFGSRGYTSFWKPYRTNEQFAICACGASVGFEGSSTATCDCGTELQAQPYV
jgi:steroid delta-isomerase-like uncharacterized protein